MLAEDQRVPLRLTAARGVLGLELYEPVELGPLTVTELALTLPGLKFPIDLSGGVPKFRHRRGQLELVRLRLEFAKLEDWLSRRASPVLGALLRRIAIWGTENGLGLGLVQADRALAFELCWAPARDEARFVVANARGVGWDVPALAVALRLLGSVTAKFAERRGRFLTIPAVGREIGRVLLPAVGARVPATGSLVFGEVQSSQRSLEIALDSTTVAAELPFAAARAVELGELLVHADERLVEGEPDAARAGYMAALERAPRHPEIVRLVAEIDARVSGRAEAALGLLVESLPATQAGVVGAELLAKLGDYTGARQAIAQAVQHESFAPLAALEWLRLAELDPEVVTRRHALDAAVAVAPGLPLPRWKRFASRVERGDIDGALADAEHLEAAETGARARHEVCRRAARALLDAGHVRDAGRLFERALRYLPDDPTATAGLARSLLLTGKARRALVLFARSVELSERRGQLDAEALLDLARTLAEHGKDLPQAIARLRQVTAASERAVEARYWEGVYRARLGDRAGAALAFGRMREAMELAGQSSGAWSAWLMAAADNALEVDDDPLAAERYLAVALRLFPQDETLLARYRDVAARAAERLRKRH